MHFLCNIVKVASLILDEVCVCRDYDSVPTALSHPRADPRRRVCRPEQALAELRPRALRAACRRPTRSSWGTRVVGPLAYSCTSFLFKSYFSRQKRKGGGPSLTGPVQSGEIYTRDQWINTNRSQFGAILKILVPGPSLD